MTLPVFVINLDRRPDRWEAISARLDRLGIVATRIPAVDARQLVERELVHAKGFLIADIANMRSQAEAMRLLLESDHPAALILEDDAVLAPDTPTLLESFGWWPEGSHAVRLEIVKEQSYALHAASGRTPSGRNVHRIGKWVGGAGAYMIDREGALLIYAAFSNPIQASEQSLSGVDRTLFHLPLSRLARRLRPAQIVPAMTYQDDSSSDYDPWRPEVPRSGKHRIMRPLKRATYYLWPYWPQKLCGLLRNVPVAYSDHPDPETRPESTADAAP